VEAVGKFANRFFFLTATKNKILSRFPGCVIGAEY
jgi:hypothetical protein